MSDHAASNVGQLGARRESAVRALSAALVPGSEPAQRLALNRAAAAVASAPAGSDLDRVALDAARAGAAEHVVVRPPARRGLIRRTPDACGKVPRIIAARAAGQ